MTIPILHSLPGSLHQIHLDFGGGVRDLTGTVWGYLWPTVTITPFDADAAVRDVFARVSGAFAAFDVDVTTEVPTAAPEHRQQVIIGGDGKWYYGKRAAVSGVTMEGCSPNFVFPVPLGNNLKNVAAIVCHELGHVFGLVHDSTTGFMGRPFSNWPVWTAEQTEVIAAVLGLRQPTPEPPAPAPVPGGVMVSVNSVARKEGNLNTDGTPFLGAFTFAVTLSAPSPVPVVVTWATEDGTAKAGVDYKAASGKVTFNPGVTARYFAVYALGNTIPEPNKVFTVKLTGATGATIAQGTGIGTILNDDGSP